MGIKGCVITSGAVLFLLTGLRAMEGWQWLGTQHHTDPSKRLVCLHIAQLQMPTNMRSRVCGGAAVAFVQLCKQLPKLCCSSCCQV